MDKRLHIFDFDADKICIVINVTNEAQYNITFKSLQQINIPEGKTIELCEICNADSVGDAYNQAIAQSNAKYKVYIQEGTKILNKNILHELLDLFEYEYKAGIIGMSGSEYIPVDVNIYKTDKYYGSVHDCMIGNNILGRHPETGAKPVDALDGIFLATQYDIPWQADNFPSLYYLTLAQCTEFRKNGYAAMVMKQEKPWVAFPNFIKSRKHDNAEEREIFKNLYYKDVFPLVSILIPTHNRPEYLKIALESAINQTYKNLEILVSDDSDDDRTYQLIQEYLEKDDRIRYFYHKGINSVSNHNVLSDNFNGEYINWLMDDDYFYPEKISTMIEYYREYDNISLVTSYRDWVGPDGHNLEYKNLFNLEETTVFDGNSAGETLLKYWDNFVGEPTTPLLRAKYIDLCGKWNFFLDKFKNIFLRKTIQWDIGTKKSYGMTDIMTWLNLMTKGDVVFITKRLSAFRYHEGQDQKINGHVFMCISQISQYLLLHYCYEHNWFINNSTDFFYLLADVLEKLEIIDDRVNKQEMNMYSIDYSEPFNKCIEFAKYELEHHEILNIFDMYDF